MNESNNSTHSATQQYNHDTLQNSTTSHQSIQSNSNQYNDSNSSPLLHPINSGLISSISTNNHHNSAPSFVGYFRNGVHRDGISRPNPLSNSDNHYHHRTTYNSTSENESRSFEYTPSSSSSSSGEDSNGDDTMISRQRHHPRFLLQDKPIESQHSLSLSPLISSHSGIIPHSTHCRQGKDDPCSITNDDKMRMNDLKVFN
jgi:hypothetical protein